MNASTLKVCVLGATFGTGNMGVSALTAGIIKSVVAQYPNAQIVLLDYGMHPESYNLLVENRTIRVPLLNMRFSKKIYLKNNIAMLIALAIGLKLIPVKRMKAKIIARNEHLKTICDADVIAAISGGDSFSDIYGLARFFYVALPQLLVLLLKKKLILLPQTLGPFNRRLTRMLAQYIMRHANLIYSRDHTGLAEMRNFVPAAQQEQKLRFCYDIGFVLDSIKPAHLDLGDFFNQKKNSITIGFNISGLLYMGGYSRNNMFQLKLDYAELVTEIIDFLLKKENTIVILIPHVFGSSENSENDAGVCSKVYSELKEKYSPRLFCVNRAYDQNEIKYIIGLCDFFIGSRMHACIAALSQFIPAVAIAYSPKFFGVIQTIEMESLVADPKRMTSESVLSVIDHAYEQRKELCVKLERKIPEVQRAVLDEFRRIVEASIEKR